MLHLSFAIPVAVFADADKENLLKSILSTYRKLVLEVAQPARVVSSDRLRGIVSFALRISDKSTITQEIVMDALCPYIRFNTEVLYNNNHIWRYLSYLENFIMLHPSISGEVG